MNYDSLLDLAYQEGLTIKEKPLSTYDGRIKNKTIYLRQNMNTAEKSCVLSEELGHYYTTVGDILDQTDAGNRKQEQRARLWGYNLRIGLTGIIRAYEHGCTNRYEMAEYLEVSEEYLDECLERYREKYGVYTTVDNYVIYFIPSLMVCKLIK